MSRRAYLLCILVLAGCSSPPSMAPTAGPGPDIVSRGADVASSSGAVNELEISTGGATTARTNVPAPLDTAWAALLMAYQDLGFKVDAVDEPNHALGAHGQRLGRRIGNDPLSSFFDCGSGPTGSLADRYQVQVDVSTRLSTAQRGTDVATTILARATNPQGASSTPVACGSTGALEARIAGLIRTHSVVH